MKHLGRKMAAGMLCTIMIFAEVLSCYAKESTGMHGIVAHTQEVTNQEYQGAAGSLMAGTEILNPAAQTSVSIENFILECYWADLCLNPESVSYDEIATLKQYEIPSQILVRIAADDESFQNSVALWKAANYAVDPSKIASGMLDEKGYYEAIIFSVFMAQTSNKDYIYDISKRATAETNSMISQISKWVKETDALTTKVDIQNGKISNLSPNDKEEIEKYLKDSYLKNHPMLDNASTIGEAVGTVFEVTDSLVDAIDKLASFMQLSEVSTEIKTVIQEMYRQCSSSNGCMKSALFEAAASVENAQSGLAATVLDTLEDFTVTAVGGIFDEWWHGILASNPYGSAFLNGAKLGIFISNMLFSTDKSIEQYVKMKCLGEFYSLLTKVKDGMASTYKSSKTAPNARNYLAAVQAMFTTSQLSCDFAISFEDVIYKDAAMGVFLQWFKGNSYDEYVKVMTGRKEYYVNGEHVFQTEYKGQMMADYPELYEVYYNDVVRVTGMHFEVKEITVGTEDAFSTFPSPVFEPFNASRPFADYQSSDPSVLEISGPIVVCEAKKPGTVTVTAVSWDGGFTDTVIVHVVEGKSSMLQEKQEQMVIASGGINDIKWKLYNGGRLVISGKGTLFSDGSWKNYEITSAEIEEGVTAIGIYTFDDCSSLKTFELSETVSRIESYAFRNCNSLKKLELPGKMSYIGERAFSGCSSLETIELPDSVRDICSYAFSGCSSLKTIGLPGNISYIGERAFSGCSNLEEVYTTEEKMSEGEDCRLRNAIFSGCKNLKRVELPSNVSCIGEGDYDFYGCSSLETIKLSENISRIGNWAFSDCSNLKAIELSKNVSHIGIYAFFYCSSLQEITIPKSVRSIGEAAFYGFDNQLSVYYDGTMSDWDNIEVSQGNYELYSAIIYCSDGIINGRITDDDSENEDGESDNVSGSTSSDNSGSSQNNQADDRTGNTSDSTSSDNSGSSQNNQTQDTTPSPTPQPTTYKITFKANGGKKLTQSSRQVAEGKAIGTLPTVVRSGYAFTGWYTKKSSGTKVMEQFLVTANQTLYARWSKVKKPGKVKSITVKSKKSGNLVISYKKVKQASGYEVSYSTKSNFKGSTTKKIYVSSLKKEIKKLKKGKTYYVRVRAYAEDSTGKKIYGSYSAKKSKKVK